MEIEIKRSLRDDAPGPQFGFLEPHDDFDPISADIHGEDTSMSSSGLPSKP